MTIMFAGDSITSAAEKKEGNVLFVSGYDLSVLRGHKPVISPNPNEEFSTAAGTVGENASVLATLAF